MAFAIGEGAIANPATYSFDCNLNVFADPIEWLKHGRDGTVIIRWSGCFDKLRDAPRVAVDEDHPSHIQARHETGSHAGGSGAFKQQIAAA